MNRINKELFFCCSLFIKIFPQKNNDENFIFNHWPGIQWRLQAEK